MVKGFDGIDKVADETERAIQREQYSTLIANNMVFYENVYSQFKAGLLDREIYDGWDKDLAAFIETHNLADHWERWRHLYRPDFGNRVKEIIESQKRASQQTSN